jgi:hypothetical protein
LFRYLPFSFGVTASEATMAGAGYADLWLCSALQKCPRESVPVPEGVDMCARPPERKHPCLDVFQPN